MFNVMLFVTLALFAYLFVSFLLLVRDEPTVRLPAIAFAVWALSGVLFVLVAITDTFIGLIDVDVQLLNMASMSVRIFGLSLIASTIARYRWDLKHGQH